MDRVITKSKYIAGIQCLKYLWYLFNAPDEIPPFDEATEFRFQQGHDVGNLAKSLFPGGIDIEHGGDVSRELAIAKELADSGGIDASAGGKLEKGTGAGVSANARRALFEAAFKYKNAFARVDILEPSGRDSWNIIEVKSASSIKEINKHDIAFQKYCYEGAGLKINKCFLMYLNKNFIKDGPIDPQMFFAMDDVTAEAEMLKQDVEKNIEMMIEAISSKTCPAVSISKNCYNPYDCQLKQCCWKELPKHNVFELYRGNETAFYFYQRGISEISHIPDISLLNNEIHRMQYRAIKENCTIIDREKIGHFLEKLVYPVYFLDFETFATAIPLFDGLSPYQSIPFQFSCHKMETIDAEPGSFYFLAEDDKEDPRAAFLESLQTVLGYGNKNIGTEEGSIMAGGSILVYYESFEKNILKKLAASFPGHSWWIEDAVGRITDLYEPFGKFYYYNPAQKGSASLKYVLPSLTGISYEDMEIKNGQEASLKFLNITFLKSETEPDKSHIEKIRKDLLDYCGLDTEGMIFILKELYKMIQ